ncbi:MAG: glycosyltransferase [Candidatus Limnocylindrales bacterium]
MPSLLRLAGIVLGIVLVVIAIWIGRRAANRSWVGVLGLAGLCLVGVAIFPDAVVPVQHLFGLDDAPLGRLTTAMLVAITIGFLLTFYVMGKAERTNQRLRGLVRALSAAQLVHDQSAGPLGGVLVVIPAFDEAASLPAVLDEIPRQVAGLDTHVLLVDDGSTDGTGAIARERGLRVVQHIVRSGQSAALQTGYLVAEQLGALVVVTMDADGQHDPTQIERLVQPIVNGDLDFVIGSRIMGEYHREAGRGGALRSMGVGTYTRITNVLGGTNITDIASGFRGIRASKLAAIAFAEDQFHNPELLMGAVRQGLRVGEVPITIRRRTAGVTKKPSTFRYGLGFLKVMIRSWLR